MEIKYEMRTSGNMETLSFINIVVEMDKDKIYNVDTKINLLKVDVIKMNQFFCNAKTKVSIKPDIKRKYVRFNIPRLLSNKNEEINRNKVINDLIKMIQVIVNSENFDKNIEINYLINKEGYKYGNKL